MAKKKNWNELKDRSYTETARGRDVFEEQQLERGHLQEKQSMTSRKVLAAFIAVIVFLVVYLLWAGVSAFRASSRATSSEALNALYDDSGGGVVTGYMTDRQQLMPLTDGRYRDRDNNVYEVMDGAPKTTWTDEDGVEHEDIYVKPTGQTVDEMYGSDPNAGEDSSGEESSGSGGTTYEVKDDGSVDAAYIRYAAPRPNMNHVWEWQVMGQGSLYSMYDGRFYERANSFWGKAGESDPEGYWSGIEIDTSKKYCDIYVYENGEFHWSTFMPLEEAEAIARENSGHGGSDGSGGDQEVGLGSTWMDAGEEGGVRAYVVRNDSTTGFMTLTKDGKYRDGDGVVYDASMGRGTVMVPAEGQEDVEDPEQIEYVESEEQDIMYFRDQQTTVAESYVTKEDREELKKAGSFTLIPRSFWQVFVSVGLALMTYMGLIQLLKKNLDAQNMLADTSDINQYTNDQHIQLPEEIQRNYDWFPDVGAHSSVLVSSMISHMALTNKGINKIKMAKRYKKDVVDEDGNVVYYKGEVMRDENGEALTEEVPMFDEKFAEALFEASGAPKEVRMSYDPSVIPYNPGNGNRDKLQGPYDGPTLVPKKKVLPIGKEEPPAKKGKFEMVTDLVNKDWTFPEYEPQRPGGAYIVDTAPVNTMVWFSTACAAKCA